MRELEGPPLRVFQKLGQQSGSNDITVCIKLGVRLMQVLDPLPTVLD